MKHEILDSPDFGFVKFTFEARGESLVAESGAMVGMSTEVVMTTAMRGGLLQAAKRKLMGGESLFQNTFEPTAPGQYVLLAPGTEGDVRARTLGADESFFLQSGAYLCHHGGLTLDSKMGGFKSFFGGVGFFMLKCVGPGTVFYNAYGALREVAVGPEGLVVDNDNVVGFTEGLEFEVRKFGGFKGLFFGGEGLVTHFRGQGSVFLQTRKAPPLASFLEGYRRVRRSSGGD